MICVPGTARRREQADEAVHSFVVAAQYLEELAPSIELARPGLLGSLANSIIANFGDIIVFQMDPGQDHNYELPTARDYFRDLFYKVRTLPIPPTHISFKFFLQLFKINPV